MSLTKNLGRLGAWLVVTLGVVFLVVPLAADSYSHYLQNRAYLAIHNQVISCRANIALKLIENASFLTNLERSITATCSTLPKYEDVEFQSSSGILALYNWIAQKISFIPL